MARRSRSSAPRNAPPVKASDAMSGAAYISKYALELFDRRDGERAPWAMMADALRLAMLHCIDKAGADALPVLLALDEAAYNRLAAGPDAAAEFAAVSAPSTSAGTAHRVRRGLPAPRPKGFGGKG